MKFVIGVFLGLMAGFSSVQSVFAQGLDEQCLKNVEDICGGTPANVCFDSDANWKQILPGCEGDVQTLFEMANEAMADNAIDPSEGASWGGKVRSGPGLDYEQIGSLKKGDLVTLEENVGDMMDDYPWFKIIHIDNQTGYSISGYQWGGILCAFDHVDGVNQTCPIEWSDNPERTNITEDAIAPVHGPGE